MPLLHEIKYKCPKCKEEVAINIDLIPLLSPLLKKAGLDETTIQYVLGLVKSERSVQGVATLCLELFRSFSK